MEGGGWGGSTGSTEPETVPVPDVAGGGDLEVDEDPGQVWRVGYRPQPWAWTPWEYADQGVFPGRWDDPEGEYRTVYVGDTLLSCLLEVLAGFRPDPVVVSGVADVVEDPEDARDYPTAPAGALPRDWIEPRRAGHATLTGRYAAVTRAGSLAALRSRFLSKARELGLPDVDAGTLKQADSARPLTRAVSRWLYRLRTEDDQPLVDGVRFDSRHGDGRALWAVLERPGDPAVSPHFSATTIGRLPAGDLLDEAMRLHDLRWE